MNLIKADKSGLTFQLGTKEQELFLALLDSYPRLGASHRSILAPPATLEKNKADLQLLKESLQEHRRDNKRHLRKWLRDQRRVTPIETGCRITLSRSDVEWLLQVLNDIRVGSWVRLGAPREDLWDFELNEKTAPHAFRMEAAGKFQAALLDGLRCAGGSL